MLAGFGLGTLGLSLGRPVPEVMALPPPVPAAQPETEPQPPPEVASPWPDAFGTPVVAAPEAPEPEPEPEPARPSPPVAPVLAAPAYILRGTVTDGAGGWVLAEGPDGIELVRLGRRLSGGEVVIDISAEGVVLERDGRPYQIAFDPEPPERPESRSEGAHLHGPRTDSAVHAPPWAESPARRRPASTFGLDDPDFWDDEYDDDDDFDDDDDDDFDDDDFDDDDDEFESWMDVMDAREDALD